MNSLDFKKIAVNCRLFEDFSEEQLQALLEKARERDFSKMELVFSEGSIGDELYIILNGSARVFTYNTLGQEIVLARLETGDFFGEQALLTIQPAPRNASVMALTPLKTLALSQKDFQNCLQVDKDLIGTLNKKGALELIKKLTSQHETIFEKEFTQLCSNIRQYEKGEVLFWQNDPAEDAYYLLSGSIEIRIFDEHKLKTRTLINQGDFFGELGVIDKKPRSGSAVALCDSSVAVISAAELHKLVNVNVDLQTLFSTKRLAYSIPNERNTFQHLGVFLGKPAIFTTIVLKNGEVLSCCRSIKADFFSIAYLHQKNASSVVFKNSENHSMEILLEKGHLVGAVCVGKWNDLSNIYINVYEKIALCDEQVQTFQKTGTLPLPSIKKASENYLCNCMCIHQAKIESCIMEGCNTVSQLAQKTGAGSVCGSCIPRLQALLGLKVWSQVKILEIIEHNKEVRTYQLQPDQPIEMALEGQHVVVEGYIQGYWIARSYTLTDVNSNRNYYEISVKRETKGLFSNWLFANDSDPSILLRISRPQGNFTCDSDHNHPVVCLMAGIGITPGVAFARNWTATGKNRLFYIDYSARNEVDFIFHKQLQDVSLNSENFTVHYRVTTRIGRLEEKALGALVERFPHANFYICGPKAYERSVAQALEKIGVEKGRVNIEAFNYSGGPISEEPV